LWKEYSDSDGNDFESIWPAVDEDFLKLDDFQLIIQVNGKVRGKEKVAIDWEQPEIEQLAKANENVKKILANAPIKKVIYVKEKLINFVI
jgi:leucyl-tRNA synthetase